MDAENKNNLLTKKMENELAKKCPSKKDEKSQIPKKVDVEKFEIEELNKLYTEKKYDEIISRVNTLHKSFNVNVELLIIKARALAQLRRFNESDKIIVEAERLNHGLNKVLELKSDLSEMKYKILVKASKLYLQKAVELGTILGEPFFEKAQLATQKALNFVPENIDLLDNLYTIQKYLNQTEDASKTKAMIYLLNKKFITTFDRESNSSLCFIASFAFSDAPHIVDEFRWIRREFLLSSSLGKKINSAYVRLSPRFTNEVSKFPYSKLVFRLLLQPFRLLFRIASFFIQ